MLNPTVLKLAAQLDAKYQRDYERYLEACEDDRKAGYRPHYCEHGTNMWTDYDNICGPCEDSLSMSDGVFRMGYAICEAKRRFENAKEIISFVTNARTKGYGFINEDAAFAEVSRILTV